MCCGGDPVTLLLLCCDQVVEKLIRGLAMEDSRNMFALFEHNNSIDKAVESRVLVADVLAKFERWDRTCVCYMSNELTNTKAPFLST